MSDIVEAVARAICVAEGIDPDRTSIGFGHRIPKGVEYKLWEAQREKAEAAIAAVGVEIERLRAENDELYKAAGRTRAALSGWILASPGRKDEPTHDLVAAVVAEAERLRFQMSLRKLEGKP